MVANNDRSSMGIRLTFDNQLNADNLLHPKTVCFYGKTIYVVDDKKTSSRHSGYREQPIYDGNGQQESQANKKINGHPEKGAEANKIFHNIF